MCYDEGGINEIAKEHIESLGLAILISGKKFLILGLKKT